MLCILLTRRLLAAPDFVRRWVAWSFDFRKLWVRRCGRYNTLLVEEEVEREGE
jgi:hypothetical protein